MLETKISELRETFDPTLIGVKSFEDVLEAFENMWKSFDDKIKLPSRRPKISYAIGQPGAGKTSLREHILKRENMMFISGDDYRKFHPNHDELIQVPEIYETKTRLFKNLLAQLLIAKCLDKKVNFLLESIFIDTAAANRTIANAKEIGFDIEINVLDVPLDESWISANYRMLEMEAAGEAIRNVNSERYLKSYKAIRKVISQARGESTNFPGVSPDKIKIITREMILSEDRPEELALPAGPGFEKSLVISPRVINIKRTARQKSMVLGKLYIQEAKERLGIMIDPKQKIPTTSERFKSEVASFKKMLAEEKEKEDYQDKEQKTRHC